VAEKPTLFRLLIVIIALILALTGSSFAIVIGFGTVLVMTLYRDRSAFRKLGKPRFWLFSLAVVLLAGLLLGREPKMVLGLPISIEGLRAGLVMNIRAFTLVLGFVLISRSVTRDSFLQMTTRIGLPYYVPAFRTALETLPRIQNAWSDSRQESRRLGFYTLVDFLLLAKKLAGDTYPDDVIVFAVTGKRLRGKTTLLRTISQEASNRGISVGGFVQERFNDIENRIKGFKVVSLTTSEEIVIAERKVDEPYVFNEDAFKAAASWLARDAECCQLLLVDEMGMLEANDDGHAPAVLSMMSKHPGKVWVMTLRKDILDVLMERFWIAKENLIDLDDKAADREGFINRVISEFPKR